ncbi:uncharacterized protein LOC144165812 isoform X2 [Haemaphysalis longicornis]
MYALIRYKFDSKTAIVEDVLIQNFEPANVADFDPTKAYNVYWKGDDTTEGGYYSANILHLTETKEQMDVYAEKRTRVPVIPSQTKRKAPKKGTSTKKLRLDVRRAQEEELLQEVLEEEDLIPKHIHEAVKRKLKAAQDELEAVKGHLQGQSVQNVLPTSSCCCKEEDYVALRAEVKELRRLNKDLQRSLLCKAFATESRVIYATSLDVRVNAAADPTVQREKVTRVVPSTSVLRPAKFGASAMPSGHTAAPVQRATNTGASAMASGHTAAPVQLATNTGASAMPSGHTAAPVQLATNTGTARALSQSSAEHENPGQNGAAPLLSRNSAAAENPGQTSNSVSAGAAPALAVLSQSSALRDSPGQNGDTAVPSCSNAAMISGTTAAVPIEADLYWESMDDEWAAEDMGLEAPASQVQQPNVVIGSSRDDGKVYAGSGVWMERETWGSLLRAPTDSMFCRFAASSYWTPAQLRNRSVTGTLSNKCRSLGRTVPKPKLTPEKVSSLQALFHIYMGEGIPEDEKAKRLKAVRKHLCQKLGDMQRK